MSKKARFAFVTLMAAGCGAEGAAGPALSTSNGPFQIYADPYGDGRDNPAQGISGQATALEMTPSGMQLTLSVSGLPAQRDFGSHLHQLGCDEMKAGGHYQHLVAPDSPSDPQYANANNEAWLDFSTDATGKASVAAEVSWVPRPGEARSIVIHDQKTAEGGKAGAKLACLPLVF